MNLIIFFNGWGMNETIISHLKIPQRFSFYHLSFPYEIDIEIFKNYKKIFFIGWSFGVFYMADFISKHKFMIKNKFYTVAINGISHLMEKGNLDKRVLFLTYKNLNEKNMEIFYKKAGIKNFHSKKSIIELKNELKFFIDNYYKTENIQINKAFVSDNDLIIKSEIQKKYYKKNNISFTEIKGNHYIFNLFYQWEYFLGEI